MSFEEALYSGVVASTNMDANEEDVIENVSKGFTQLYKIVGQLAKKAADPEKILPANLKDLVKDGTICRNLSRELEGELAALCSESDAKEKRFRQVQQQFSLWNERYIFVFNMVKKAETESVPKGSDDDDDDDYEEENSDDEHAKLIVTNQLLKRAATQMHQLKTDLKSAIINAFKDAVTAWLADQQLQHQRLKEHTQKQLANTTQIKESKNSTKEPPAPPVDHGEGWEKLEHGNEHPAPAPEPTSIKTRLKSLIFPVVGATVGAVVLGPVGAAVGAKAGAMVALAAVATGTAVGAYKYKSTGTAAASSTAVEMQPTKTESDAPPK